MSIEIENTPNNRIVEATHRIQRLREKLLHFDPVICPERAVIWTESYKKNEDKPSVLKAAIALKDTLSNMTVRIYPEELLVGNQASALRAAPLHPQINTWFLDELDRFEQRQGSRFLISEETKEKLRECITYWQGKTVYERTMALLPSETIEATKSLVFTCNYTLTKGTGHFLLNFERVLEVGFNGIKEEAQEKLAYLEFSNPEDLDKIPFYEAIITVCEGVAAFGGRYANEARMLAAQEKDPKRQKELETIAQICDWVPGNPPRNFYEAVQTTWFMQLIAQIESDGTGLSLGRLDYYLYPFYKKDIEKGLITREFAEELIDSLWLKLAEIIEVWNEEDSKFFGGHPISQAVTVGGTHADGTDSTNDLTYICLDSTAKIRFPQPSLCVRIHRDTPPELLSKCAEVIRLGCSMPALYNDEIAIPSLVNRGVKLEHARRNFGVAGCVELGLQGQMCHFANSGYFSLLKALEVTLNNGKDPMTGVQVGLQTGQVQEITSFDDLVKNYKQQISYFLKLMVGMTNVVNTMHARHVTLPYISSFTEDCLGRGREVHDKGALYNHDGPQGVGIGDVADSLAVIKKLVFEEKKLTLEALTEAMTANFEGFEDIRNTLIKESPKYGNNNRYVDDLAREIATYFCVEVGQHQNPRGGWFVPGMYTVSANVPIGTFIGATPNGRLARTPVNDACSPTSGSDKSGPTQAALSVAHLDHLLVTNGTQYNQKYHPSALKGTKGIQSLVHLVRTYFEAGGYHIQFNVVSAETLREAQKFPEKYRDLVVRIAGYSAFFVDLDKALQDDLISRTEMNFV